MGLFSTVRGAFATSLELERAKTLANEIAETMKNISVAEENLRLAICQEFLDQREMLLRIKPTLTPEQQIDMGRRQRRSAREISRAASSRADEALSYGMWLGGAWLECGASKLEPCVIAYTVLEQMVGG
ncbi:hypothetical protein WT05_15495 [Burkholderia stagnalis]|nr:hypothetical protein WT05_15495 [Burkholderia stagnalis]